MSKKCNSCGADLTDDAMFCDKCGAKQEAAPANVTTATTATVAAADTTMPVGDNNIKKGMSKNAVIALVTCAIIALIVIVLLCSALFGGGYEKAIKAEAKAFNKEDAEYITKTMPDDLLDEYDDKYKDSGTYDDYKDALDDAIKDLRKSYEDNDDIGDNPKYSYKIVDKIKLTDKECKSIQKTIKSTIGKKLDVTTGYQVLVKDSIKGDDGKSENFTNYVVAKVDGKWIMTSGNLIGGGLAGLSSLMVSGYDY